MEENIRWTACSFWRPVPAGAVIGVCSSNVVMAAS